MIGRMMAEQEVSMATLIIFGASWSALALVTLVSLMLSVMLLKGAAMPPHQPKEFPHAMLKPQLT